jgi:hypothetical protein
VDESANLISKAKVLRNKAAGVFPCRSSHKTSCNRILERSVSVLF